MTAMFRQNLRAHVNQTKIIYSRNPFAFISIATLILILSNADMISMVLGFEGITKHQNYEFYQEVFAIFVIGLALYIAYKWSPFLGLLFTFVYIAIHLSFLITKFGNEPFEIFEFFLVSMLGITGIHFITRLRNMQIESRAHNLRLESLYRTSQEMSQTLDLNIVAGQAVEATLKALNLDAGTIRYIDEVTGDAVMLTHRGLPPALARDIQANPRLKPGQGIAGAVALSGKPEIVDDLSKYTNLIYKAMRNSGLQSAVALPLKVKGSVVGIISAFSFNRRAFTTDELDLMASLGNMVGMAISNSRLFSVIEDKGNEWERTFDSVTEGIALMAPGHRIIRANWAMARMLNTTPQELIGQHCYRVFHDLNAPIEGCPVVRCLTQKKPGETIIQEMHLGNRWFQIRADPVLNQKGELLSIVHTSKDITELKISEELLARNLSTTEAVLEMVQIAGKGLTKEDVFRAFALKLHKLIPFDKASINLLDHMDRVYHSLTTFAGHEMQVTAEEISREKASATEWLISTNKSHVETDIAEKRHFDSDKNLAMEGYRAILRVPLSFSSQPFGSIELMSLRPGLYGKTEQQTLEQLCAVISQMTWYQHIAALETAERLELQEMDEAREQFLTFLAHELRSPLTPVMASANLLAHQIPAESNNPQYRCVQNILAGAKVLEARLSDLLDIAQFRMAAFTLQLETVELESIIKGIVSRFEPVTRSKGQLFTVNLLGKLLPFKADSRRLEQVIVNLVDNAIKFTPQGGNICLSAMHIDHNLVIKVQDDGPGIPVDERNKLFQPYWRGKSDRLRFRGTGLGLAICKRLVEAHGGKIWVENGTPGGSIFSFSIPLDKPVTKDGERH